MTGRLVTAKMAATSNGPVRNEAGKPSRAKMNPAKTANRIRTAFTSYRLRPQTLFSRAD
jgi:hypothetical protein